MASYIVQGNVGIIYIDNPPVNSQSQRTRTGIYECTERAIKDGRTNAIVLCGKGKCFCGGADINEFQGGDERQSPSLIDVVDALENSTKPVVAAVHGYALGGGLELAIACHYRIAKTDAIVGFPEVKLGILPAAGGTQRFPRIVGLDMAMDWISSGRHYKVGSVNNSALFDRIVPRNANVVQEAISFARTIANKPLNTRRVSSWTVEDGDRAEEIAEKYLAKVHKISRGQYSPAVCIQAVKYAAQSSFEDGMKKERELFMPLVTSGQSRGLVYSFFAERQVQKWIVPKTDITWKTSKCMPVKLGAVIGLGTMGRGIAINFLRAGIPVLVKEMNEKFLKSGLKSVHNIIDSMERRKVIDGQQKVKMKASVTGTTSYSDLANVDLVIEAAFEEIDLKREIFQALDKACKPSAILATNTSALNIDKIASFTKRPEKVMGMHFFAPADLMRLLENVNGGKTSSETIATCMDMGKRMGKVTVLVGNCYGFVANRMYINYMNEADYLLEEGAYPENVDKALTDYGFAMGRYLVGDLSGNDVAYRVRMSRGLTAKQQIPGTPETVRGGLRYSPLADYICEIGRYGFKAGKGWYDYPTRSPMSSPEVNELIDSFRKRNSIQARRIDSQEVIERMLYALINEGFKVLDEGYAASPWDVDMIWIHGYAWPKHTGGPMFYAHTVGLPEVLKRIEYFYDKFGSAVPHWKPSAMLIRLVEKYGNPSIHDWMICSDANLRIVTTSNL